MQQPPQGSGYGPPGYQQPPQGYPPQGYPPQQQPPQKSGGALKTILIVLGTLFVLGMGSCVVCTGLAGMGANEVAKKEKKKAEEREEKLKDCKGESSKSWADLAKDLKENEAKVAKKWKGDCAKVEGVIQSIDSGFDDKPVIWISSGGQFEANRLMCKPDDEDEALELKKGEKITVWGIGGNEIAGSLVLEHCAW